MSTTRRLVFSNGKGYNGAMKKFRVIEKWAQVPGYEGLYDVSTFGQVWSRYSNRFLKQTMGHYGYLQVHLSRLGATKSFEIHRLMALAFLGPRPVGLEIRHIDGIKTHLFVGNIKYGTHSENALDIVKHGTHHEANKTHCPSKHAYTKENTYMHQGARHCKTCMKERKQR